MHWVKKNPHQHDKEIRLTCSFTLSVNLLGNISYRKKTQNSICRLPADLHVLQRMCAQCQYAGWCRGQRSNDKKSNFTLEIEFVTADSGPWDGTLVNISLPVSTVATPRSTNQEPAENQKKKKIIHLWTSLVNRHREGTVPQPINERLVKAGKQKESWHVKRKVHKVPLCLYQDIVSECGKFHWSQMCHPCSNNTKANAVIRLQFHFSHYK